MKRIFLCLAIIAALVALAIYGAGYVSGVAEDIITRLDTLGESTDSEEAKALAADTDRVWNDFYEKHIFITDKEHAMEITAALARISALAEEGSEELKIECKTARKLVELFLEKQRAEFMNVL